MNARRSSLREALRDLGVAYSIVPGQRGSRYVQLETKTGRAVAQVDVEDLFDGDSNYFEVDL